MSVEQILLQHWNKYGRNFFSRYDYEECDSDAANKVMKQLTDSFGQSDFVGKEFKYADKSYKVSLADDFQYTDPIDHSVTTKQVGVYLYNFHHFKLIEFKISQLKLYL